MNDLVNKKCVPCEGGVVPFDISEIHKYQKVDGWNITKNEIKSYCLEKNLFLRIFKIAKISQMKLEKCPK